MAFLKLKRVKIDDENNHGLICSKEHLHYNVLSQKNEVMKQNEKMEGSPCYEQKKLEDNRRKNKFHLSLFIVGEQWRDCTKGRTHHNVLSMVADVNTSMLLWSIEQDVVGEERGDDKAYITKSVCLCECVCACVCAHVCTCACARKDTLSH